MEQAGPDKRLPGAPMTATIMFCDLRGFTSFAKELEATQVMDILSRYHQEMAGAIFEHDGTLVAAAGDGLMAAFGAPIESADHADRAVATVRELLDRRLPAFNAWLEAEGLSGFDMGVGLASGPVSVGTVGFERRLEFAVVGDTTNLAARLQDATKSEGARVLIAASTVSALTRPDAALEELREIDVRGRGAVAVWTLAERSPAVSGRS
jgi:adenylate cyclase